MAALERRLQVLLDEDRYQRVKAQAEREGSSVGAAIRHAIDLAWPGDGLEIRMEAGQRLLESSAEPSAEQEPDWEDHKYDPYDEQWERVHETDPVR